MPRRAADKEAWLSSVLWSSLKYLASKRAERELLEDDSVTPVSIEINAKVNRQKLTENLDGWLNVAAPGTRAKTSGASVDVLCALLLDQVGEAADQHRVMKHIEDCFVNHNSLPPVAESQIAIVKTWLSRLRSTSIEEVAGSVTFKGSL